MTSNEQCPVCGKSIRTGNMIFHMRKTSVFEIYKAYKEGTLGTGFDISVVAPHEAYILANTKKTDVFEM